MRLLFSQWLIEIRVCWLVLVLFIFTLYDGRYDTLRVNKIMHIHKKQAKQALKIYKQNVLDAHEEANQMKHEMGKVQDDQAKHLQLQTKEFERNKNNIERNLASAALEKLRLNQR